MCGERIMLAGLLVDVVVLADPVEAAGVAEPADLQRVHQVQAADEPAGRDRQLDVRAAA